MGREFFVYIMASGRNGTLYIGVTSELRKRVWAHKEGVFGGFTAEYGVNQLVWFEQCPDAESAISSEKRLKAWKRAWKLDLIEKTNPYWRDLYGDITA
jgi:putative endonuclease